MIIVALVLSLYGTVPLTAINAPGVWIGITHPGINVADY